MSIPSNGEIIQTDGEPSVQIRRSLTSGSGPGGYNSFDPGQGSSGPEVVVPSVNSVNEQNGGIGVIPGRRKGDKTPLLHSDLLRSLSGSISGPGLDNVGRADGLATFPGVFAPVALSMFSVLLFLRLGFVVGQSGILVTIVQLALAYSIVLFTVFSLCAISTNGAIEGGGVYYMISRALGPEFGGSIGVLFFLANVFSCALYISGFTEALVNNFGPGGYSGEYLYSGYGWQFLYSFGVSILILIICLVGAALFAKTSVILLVVVGVIYGSVLLSLIIKNHLIPVPIPKENSIVYESGPNGSTITDPQYGNYTGMRFATYKENLYPDYGVDYSTGKDANFAIVFAIVFSGVTGIMAGANMSGDLKQPHVSIPRGTLQSVAFTFLIYILTTFLLGSSCSRYLLQNDYIVLQYINVWQPFILTGIFATTLFAGMSNLIGASRVLTRLAEDRLFGFLLHPASIMVGNQNPIFAVFFSWAISVAVLLVGALNRIAQIASIFFLLSYMGVNLACLALDLASAPNFRPGFKFFTWHTALIGFVGCVGMMFVVDPVMSGVAIILLLLLLMALHYKVLYFGTQAPVASWGSISQALIFHQVRKYLLLLDSRKDHVKYWRPQMLLMVRSPSSQVPLMDFVNDLKKSGLFVIGHVKKGSLDDAVMDPLHEDSQYWLSLIDYLKVKAFVELTVARTIREGVQQLTRISGLGAMKPNTVILGFHDKSSHVNNLENSRLLKNLKYAKLDRAEVVEYFTAKDLPPQDSSDEDETHLGVTEYVKIINDVLKLHKNICLARHFQRLDKESLFRCSGRSPRFIDVWPMDIVRPQESTLGWDNSCLFLLQLACILSMSHGWKANTTLRVFLCVTSLQDMHRRDRQLKTMLGHLRIKAKSLVVPWDHVIVHVDPSGGQQQQQQSVERDAADLPDAYLQALNDMIKRHSDNTGIVFLNMPVPPADEAKYYRYVQNLEKVSDGLPPTLFVHGLTSVISTAL